MLKIRHLIVLPIILLLTQSVFASDKIAPKEKSPANTNEPAYVSMKTNMGTMIIKLYPEKAPISVRNFLQYVDKGFYNGVIFHRVVPNFVVQGGGFDQKLQRKRTAPPIKNESNNGLKNLRGTLSMARTNAPNSATSQFFINLVANPSLDWKPGRPGYAVFGEVVEGIATIDAMALLEQGKYAGPFRNAPNEMVIIEKAERTTKPAAKSTKTAPPKKAL